LDPAQAMRDAATALAFPLPRLEVRGLDEIDRRVRQAYAMFVELGVHTFKAAGDAVYLAPALVELGWEMVTITTGLSPGAVTTRSCATTTAASCRTTSTSHRAEPRSSFSANHCPEEES
jgi:hypothetical protein